MHRAVSPVRILVIFLCVVFVAALGTCIWVAVDRWCTHDDAHDIQGTWYIYGTNVSIPIGESTMGISQDAVYDYTIDTKAKTVTYSIGNLSGTSHYRFSPDRTKIALIEDGKRVFTATLLDDISWWASNVGNFISGVDVLPGPLESDVVMLTREANSPDEERAASEEDATSEHDGGSVDNSNNPDNSAQEETSA